MKLEKGFLEAAHSIFSTSNVSYFAVVNLLPSNPDDVVLRVFDVVTRSSNYAFFDDVNGDTDVVHSSTTLNRDYLPYRHTLL